MSHCAPSRLPKLVSLTVKSRQARYSLNSLPVRHLPASHSALAGQQCVDLYGTEFAAPNETDAVLVSLAPYFQDRYSAVTSLNLFFTRC